MRRDLRLLVVRHGDVVGERRGRDAAPLRRAARPGGVEVAEVDRALGHQVAAAARGELALPGADAHAGAEADVAHRAAVVRPDARLLEPVEVEVLDEAREADRVGRRPALVGVGAEDEVRPGGTAGGAEAGGVLLRGEAADLELHPGEARARAAPPPPRAMSLLP